MVEADIGEDDSGAEVCLVAEDGVPDVVEVRDLRLVEDEAVLELAGVAQHDAVADHDILADVGSVADLAILADPCGTFDHGSLLNDCSGSDIDSAADEGLADQFAMDAGLEAELKIGRNLRQRLPDMSDILEDDTVLGAIEVEEAVRREHGENLTGMKWIKGIGKISCSSP